MTKGATVLRGRMILGLAPLAVMRLQRALGVRARPFTESRGQAPVPVQLASGPCDYEGKGGL